VTLCGAARQRLARRNIVAKRFDEIPMADIEMVFPDKRFYFKPLLLIQLSVTILGGLIAAASAMAARPGPRPRIE
jgi:hypothetical protein